MANTSRNVKVHGDKLYFLAESKEIMELTVGEDKLEIVKTNEKGVNDFEIDERGTMIIAYEQNKLKYGEYTREFKEHQKELEVVTVAFRTNVGKYSKKGILVGCTTIDYRQILFSLNRRLNILGSVKFKSAASCNGNSLS